MVFSSLTFLFYFFPAFFLAYYLVPARFKNAVILCGSILFYSWGAPRFIFVILGTTIADFYIVRTMSAATRKKIRQLLLALSLSINLGLLFYFKYSNFFADNLSVLLEGLGIGRLSWPQLVLPIGISFYTFETLTYVVDVYRGVHKPLRSFFDYQLYIILFPKLIAGPIIRFGDFADQVYNHTLNDNVDNRLRGIYRFLIGLGKKVIIANALGVTTNVVFTLSPAELTTTAAWFGALNYTFQIYFDFSGYSDMAIGLGLMMGFRFPENFNNPYAALSITDFWRRWHITLGAWMRNYLYIPLGGNRAGKPWRTYLNLFIVFLASGLWHGAAWGFIIWGCYHGLFLVLERLFLADVLKRAGKLVVLYTFPVVLISWVFFRTEHLDTAGNFLYTMFVWKPDVSMWHPTRENVIILAIAALTSFSGLTSAGTWLCNKVFGSDYSPALHVLMFLGTLVLFVVCVGKISASSFDPFIYFRF